MMGATQVTEQSSKILHFAYDVGLLVEQMARIGDLPQALQALSHSSVGLCRAVLCERRHYDVYEQEAVADLDRRLEAASKLLKRKGATASANNIDMARGMLLKTLEDFLWQGVGG
jgi:hypothetical protein